MKNYTNELNHQQINENIDINESIIDGIKQCKKIIQRKKKRKKKNITKKLFLINIKRRKQNIDCKSLTNSEKWQRYQKHDGNVIIRKTKEKYKEEVIRIGI